MDENNNPMPGNDMPAQDDPMANPAPEGETKPEETPAAPEGGEETPAM